MGGEILCLSVGECQDQEEEVGELVSREKGRPKGEGVFRGETRKEDNIWNINKEKYKKKKKEKQKRRD